MALFYSNVPVSRDCDSEPTWTTPGAWNWSVLLFLTVTCHNVLHENKMPTALMRSTDMGNLPQSMDTVCLSLCSVSPFIFGYINKFHHMRSLCIGLRCYDCFVCPRWAHVTYLHFKLSYDVLFMHFRVLFFFIYFFLLIQNWTIKSHDEIIFGLQHLQLYSQF